MQNLGKMIKGIFVNPIKITLTIRKSAIEFFLSASTCGERRFRGVEEHTWSIGDRGEYRRVRAYGE
jgi:hypothetical protein